MYQGVRYFKAFTYSSNFAFLSVNLLYIFGFEFLHIIFRTIFKIFKNNKILSEILNQYVE